MTSLFDSMQSPGRKTVLATLIAGLSLGFAAPAFATPGNVVISTVYGGGGNTSAPFTRDFVELFNRSASPISLKGMSVQYQSATGTAWAATALPDVSLAPGQYFLVAEIVGGTVGADIGTADATGTINMSATAGKVALSNIATAMPAGDGGAAVLDLVGFGSTATVFETKYAPAPSNTTALYRAAAGCTDTDNNALDFTVAGVTSPRRTTSALNACAGAAPVAQPIVLACPVSVASQAGTALSAVLRASDADSIVNGVTFVSTTTGISLSGFAPATAIGGSASVSLDVAATLATGSYSVTVNFTNNDGQAGSCVIPVAVAGVRTIPQIQGSGPTSPYANTVQTTTGVITAKVGGGFFIQDLNGDGDPTTSDGLFIYTSNFTGNIGDLVTVTGSISEYTPTGATRSYTEMVSVTSLSVQGSGYSITPTNIELPNADLARYEGMLVRFTSPLTVNGTNYLGDRGELVLGNGRREVPTNRFRPGAPEAIALAQANDQNYVILDDGIFVAPATVPYLGADGTVRSGDTVSDLTGVLDFGSIGGGGAWFKVQPTVAPTISRTNARTDAPVIAASNIKVASANVLNFFTTFLDGTDVFGNVGQGCTIGTSTAKSNCRGADNLTEFVRQRDKIVNELKAMDADAVGLMEIQNNNDVAVTYLVDQLNLAIGATTYAVVPKPAATGTDAIRVAMIYKPAKLTLVGGALSDGDVVNNRAPIAATFKANNGGKFSLIVNHLKSKGSCPSSGVGDVDIGDGQGCWNATRVTQATRLVNYFIPQVIAAAGGDPDVVIVGDMNSYGFEDPIAYYTSHGLVSELERFVRPRTQPYSYVFDGESGYLDHALVTAAFDSQVVDVSEWHNNADEPTAIDYNIGDTAVDYYTDNAFRASDHDPVVIALNIAPSFLDVTASVKIAQSGVNLVRATGKYTGTVTFTNTSSAALAGPLSFVLDNLTAGVTLANASGTLNGAPYITLPGGLAAGASVTVTTTFTVAKPGVGYTPKLLSGSF